MIFVFVNDQSYQSSTLRKYCFKEGLNLVSRNWSDKAHNKFQRLQPWLNFRSVLEKNVWQPFKNVFARKASFPANWDQKCSLFKKKVY